MYKLQVIASGNSVSCGTDIWDKFADWVIITRGVRNIDSALKELGGENLTGTPYIEFETSEEAIVFKLRFSQ